MYPSFLNEVSSLFNVASEIPSLFAKSSLIIDINDSKLNCYRGTVEQADVTAKVKTAVFEQVLDGTKTFQSAFMSGELSAQGNFKILRNFDTIFRFQNI